MHVNDLQLSKLPYMDLTKCLYKHVYHKRMQPGIVEVISEKEGDDKEEGTGKRYVRCLVSIGCIEGCTGGVGRQICK